MNYVTVLALAIGLSTASQAADTQSLDQATRHRIDEAVDKVIAGGAPGISLAVVKGDQVVYAQGYGLAGLGQGARITADTPMEIGSVTKQFTAAAILQLVEKGKLSLDDELGRYVPEYKQGAKITLRQLLWQVSGIPDYVSNDAIQAGKDVEGKPSVKRILDRIAAKPMDFPTGEKWEYCNSNYFLLGLVVERVSGLSYEAYLRKNLFAPAGMSHTTTMAHEKALKSFPEGHWRKEGKLEKAPGFGDLWAFSAGNIVSDVYDMAKWDEALTGGKIISPASLQIMLTPGHTNDGKPTIYGMGWVIGTVEGHPLIWHNGGTLGFVAMNAIYPAEDTALIALVNSTDILPQSITAAVFDVLYPDLAAQRLKAAEGEEPAVTAKVKTLMETMQAGTLDTAQLSDTAKARMTADKQAQVKQFLESLGPVEGLIFKGEENKDGNKVYAYLIRYGTADLSVSMAIDGEGKIATLKFSQ